MGQLAKDHHSVTPKLPLAHIVDAVQEKLTSFHTLFNFSVDPDFINTPDAIKLLDRSIELHTDFTKAFGLIDSIVIRHVAFTKDQKPKRKVSPTGMEARPGVPSNRKPRKPNPYSIVLSDSDCENSSSND